MARPISHSSARTERASQNSKGGQITEPSADSRRTVSASKDTPSERRRAHEPQPPKSGFIERPADPNPQTSRSSPSRRQVADTLGVQKDPDRVLDKQATQCPLTCQGNSSGQSRNGRAPQTSQSHPLVQQPAAPGRQASLANLIKQQAIRGRRGSQRGPPQHLVFGDAQPQQQNTHPLTGSPKGTKRTRDGSQFRPGASIPPESQRRQSGLPISGATRRQNRPDFEDREIQFDFSTEITLLPKTNLSSHPIDSSSFVQTLADRHNQEVPGPPHARMRAREGGRPEWAVQTSGIEFNPSHGYSLNLCSPIFRNFGSHWQQDIRATWEFLERHYDVEGADSQSSFAVGLDPTYTLEELQRIAQAIVHFEDAIFQRLQQMHGIALDCERNWKDNPRLMNLTKYQVFDMIDSQQSVEELVELMDGPYPEGEGRYTRFWGFRGLTQPWKVLCTDGFPNLASPEEAIRHGQFTLSFVIMAMETRNRQRLLSFTPNSHGLGFFLTSSGLNPR